MRKRCIERLAVVTWQRDHALVQGNGGDVGFDAADVDPQLSVWQLKFNDPLVEDTYYCIWAVPVRRKFPISPQVILLV